STGFVNTGVKPLSVTLTAGQNSTGNHFFQQQRDAQISGKVYNDLNGNGSLDAGEPGIAGVSVALTGGTPSSPGTTTTDASGGYSFTGLPKGYYSVNYTL